MEQSTEQYNFFVDGKLNLQKLRHDISGTLFILNGMLEGATKHPERRKSEYDPIIQETMQRLDKIVGSLRPKGNLVEFVDRE